MLLFQDIKFTMILDVYDLCTEELQKKLLPAREKFKEEEDRRVEEKVENECSLGLSTLGAKEG